MRDNPVDIILYGQLFGFRILYIVGAALVFVVGVVLVRTFSRKQNTSHTTAASCACGWSGQVGKHARRCPKCNAQL